MVQIATERKGGAGRYKAIDRMGLGIHSKIKAQFERTVTQVESAAEKVGEKIQEGIDVVRESLGLRADDFQSIADQMGLPAVRADTEGAILPLIDQLDRNASRLETLAVSAVGGLAGFGRLGVAALVVLQAGQLVLALGQQQVAKENQERANRIIGALKSVQVVLAFEIQRSRRLLIAAGDPLSGDEPKKKFGDEDAALPRAGGVALPVIAGGAALALLALTALAGPRSRRSRRRLGKFNPERLESIDTFDLSDFESIKGLITELGLANDRLAEALAEAAAAAEAAKVAAAEIENGGGMGRSRRRRRMRGMGFVPGADPALGRLGQTDEQVAEEFIEQNRAAALGNLAVMRSVAVDTIVDLESIRTEADLSRQEERDIRWAGDINDWAALSESLLRGEGIPDTSLPFYQDMTRRLKRHATIVLKNQAAIFESQGDLANAQITREVLQSFKNIEALGRSARLSGIGRLGSITLLVLLAFTAVSLAGLYVGGQYLVTKQQDNTIRAAQVKIRQDLLAKIAAARERGDLKTVDRLTRILEGELGVIGWFQTAADILGNLSMLLLVGAGVFVGFRFVIPAIQDFAARKRGEAPESRAQAPPAEPRGKPLSKGERKVFEGLEARSGVRAQMLG